MIIDAHSHLRVPIAGFEGTSHSSYGMQTDDVEKFLADYEGLGVDACFVFMNEGLRLESIMAANNDALARARDQHPDRLYPWATVCPAWSERKIRAEVRRVLRDLGMQGLKFVPIVQGFPISTRGMDIVAEECIDLKASVVFHDGSPEYCSALQVAYYARKYPDLPVMSGHGGLREQWRDLIGPMRELPNLWLCLSGPTQLGIQTLYDELGPDRLLFGSDGGLGHPAVTTAYLRRIRAMDASEEHKAMILGGNARRFLEVSERKA